MSDGESLPRDDVTVLIPTLNEAETIGEVIQGFHDEGYTTILVADGGSTDETVDIATEHGAEVFVQRGAGKGRAVKQAFDRINTQYTLMVDGDGTYDPADADTMVEPLVSGDALHVIGNRFAEIGDSMSRMHRFGNQVINRLFEAMYGRGFSDILSGYRAFDTHEAREMSLYATGFEIETELAVESVRRRTPTVVVPISYFARPDGSDSNLNPFGDGFKICLTAYKLSKASNPLLYFGVVGGASIASGMLCALYVLVEYVTRTVSHEVYAILAVFLILFGVQLFMFGALSDLITSFHHEQLRAIDQDD